MKRLVSCLLLASVLYADGSIFDINPLKTTKDLLNNIVNDEPKWLQEYKNGDMEFQDRDHLYYIGKSSHMNIKKQRAAEQEARRDALVQIGSYINVSVDSSTDIGKKTKNGRTERNINKSVNTISIVALDGIREDKIYTVKDGEDIIVYTFYKVRKEFLDKKKVKYEKETKEYNKLIEKFNFALEENKVNKAKDLVFKIEQYRRSKYDTQFQNLKDKLASSYEVYASLNKENFKLGEYLKINLRPTQSVYTYVLLEYKNSRKLKLIFPSRFDSNNLLKANKLRKLKKVKISKEYTTKRKQVNKIIVYASTSPLSFKDYARDGNKLSTKEDSGWKTMLEDRIYYKDEILFKVENKKSKKRKVCVLLDGKGIASNVFYEITKQHFRKQNFKVSKSCNNKMYKVILSYNERSNYDGMLEQTIRHISYNLSATKGYEDIYTTDDTKNSLSSYATSSQIAKELRGDLEENIMDIIIEIKDSE
ncbi:MAG: DUF4384 domain-containing protein [Campylobacterota bacterium]|nr:DUF4384 domain-containing protein [Campylobacterota bacterium]